MKLLTYLLIFGGLMVAGLHAESFDPANAEPLTEDRAFLLKLAEGTRQARLQVRNEAGAWEVHHVVHLAGDEGFLKLRLPDDVALEDCRAEVSMSDPFPYHFYATETAYEQKETGNPWVWRGDVALDGAGGGAGAPEGDQDNAGDPDQVQESDLWQWRGNTLYFFNQLRGLQVFDLSDTAHPNKLATLRMPAVGDQMYVLDDQHVLLLANYVNYRAYGWADIAVPYSSIQQTEAIVVKHVGDSLEIVSRVAVKGDYLESRLVGDRLYLVTRLHEPVEDEEGGVYWKQGLLVNGIRLTDPTAPTQLEPLELIDNNGWFWNSVVTASPEHLLVTTSHYDQVARQTRSRVHVIPIGRELSIMEVAHTVSLKAHLPDKFKLRVKEDILTTVSQRNVWREELTTYVESFDLSGEKARKLDELILAPQERLHATRFDGDRLYVVTFFVELRKDPLFVIDLTNPSNLKSLGELEIPGWSTYLVPEGDRLLSVGIEDNRVAISLFDVSVPSELNLVERVYPGEGRSWSEANWDEKAVGYLTEQDLLLLPIQTQVKTQDGYEYKNLMQIVDVHHDSLEVRGAIEHEVQGRRATALGTDVVSISGKELLVVDAANPDAPVLTTEEVLAWDAFKVLEVGDTLWQMGQGYSWKNGKPTPVTVTSKGDVEQILGQFELPRGGVAGFVLDGSTLYLARYRQWSEEVALPVEEGQEPLPPGEEPDDGEKPEVIWEWRSFSEFYTDVYDVSDPLHPVALGSVKLDLGDGRDSQLNGLNQVSGEWIDGRLVWYPRIVSAGHYGGYYPVFFDVGIAADVDVAAPGRFGYYYGGYPSYDLIRVIAVDVSDPAAPVLASETVIDPKDYAEFGPLHFRGDRLLLSYKESFFEELRESLAQTTHRYSLREINFADPALPVMGNPVSLPGLLEGVLEDNGGEVLITSAPEMEVGQEPEQFYLTSNGLLQASIYDGSQVFLVSEIEVPEGRFKPTAVLGQAVYKPGTDKEEGPGLHVWRWERSEIAGGLRSEGILSLSAQPQDVIVHEGRLFAGYDQTVGVVEGDRVAELALSGPVYTQNLKEIEVGGDGAWAWLAAGVYGVEPLNLEGLRTELEMPPLAIAAQVEGWFPAIKEQLYHVLASGADVVGPLGPEEGSRFRALMGLQHYADWSLAHFNPCGDAMPAMAAPGVDADADEVPNVFEFVYDTLPLSADSVPMMEFGLEREAGSLKLKASVLDQIGTKAVVPVVERSRDLLRWEAAEVDLEERRLDAGDSQSFFRLRLQVPGGQ